MKPVFGGTTMTAEDLAQLPVFLRSYKDLNNHLRDTLDEYPNTTDKGRAFAHFVSRVAPLSSLGDRFTKIEVGVDGPDGGVDLVSTSIDGQLLLYGQSKLTIRNASDIELIISKFNNYYESIHTNKVGQRYIADFATVPVNPDAKKPSKPRVKRGVTIVESNDEIPKECMFFIATLSKIKGKDRILDEYEKSSYTGNKYYDELVAAGKLVILDGEDLFPLAQSAVSAQRFRVGPASQMLHSTCHNRV